MFGETIIERGIKMSINKEFVEDFGKIIKKYDNRIEKMMKEYERSFSNDSRVTSKVKGLEKLFKEAEETYDALKGASEETWDTIHEKSINVLKSLKDSFYEVISTVNPSQVAKLRDEAIEIGEEQLHTLERYMEKKPLMTALVVLGIGFFVGMCAGGGRK
jgi:ElaB/YqjD/DUF883 family membrane-anchored ribosome-binding protein